LLRCEARPMPSPSLVKLAPHTPEKALSVLTYPLKLHDENVLKRQYLSRGLIDFAQICTEFKRMTSEMLFRFQIKRSKGKVTA